MLRDIQRVAVEDIAIAVVPKDLIADEEGPLWEVYILNLKKYPIENVIVASKGYGVFNGEDVKTSTLRHYLGDMPPMSFMLIEPIQEKVFGLNNEYWLSFYINREIFDKKYIFLPESINESYFTMIPLLEKRGVMIR
ncbi:MAG: hypothetical protein IPN36_04240 [Bacteroidetes bacterium]|jgi:hypothetical protein|nr:hypothetical protein [Bacteroidota bacterium]MBK9400080.1 hypothetical protein [Bacteroidota bacterium]MBL0097939.1 hypothetical protein [Bacteroidota bacterium]